MSLALRSLHAVANLDGTLDPRYPLGNKPIVGPSTLDINLVAFAAANINLQNLSLNAPVSINYRQFLIGTSAATATLSVNASIGSLGNWSISGNNLTNSAALTGSGSLYVSANDGAGTIVNFPIQQWSIIAGAVQTRVWAPGVHYTIGNIGGQYTTIAAAMTDWRAQASGVANRNASRVCKGLQICVNLKLLFPVAQGDWGNSQGISLLTQFFQYVATLPNGPYAVSVSCNMVGNTYGNTTITQTVAQKFCPPWWYDNGNYGPVSGGNHGGIYWDGTAPGHMTLRFWNAACMNEVRQCWQAIYQALEPQGMHLYRVEPTMEISGAAAMISAGMTDQQFIDMANGTTGIPNGFAADMHGALPNSLLAIACTYPRSQSSAPAILEAFLSHGWSATNYDGCCPVTPADLTGLNVRSTISWQDLAFCGQTAVNGSIVSKNYKALGYDHHNNVVADELGNGTTAVPKAIVGSGRIHDIVNVKLSYQNSSHLYMHADTYSGPPCNTTGNYTSQPANYKYPASGATVTQTNSLDLLNALNVNASLQLVYPSVF